MSSSYLDYNYITNSEIISERGINSLKLPNGVIQAIELTKFDDFNNDYYSKYKMGDKIPFLVERKLRFRSEAERNEKTSHFCGFGNYTFGKDDINSNSGTDKILAKNDYQSINFNNYILDNIITNF